MNRHLTVGYVFLVVSILFWAGNTVVARDAMIGDVPPIALNFWRWVGALAIMAPFTATRVWRHRASIARKWWYFLAFAIVSVTCFNTFFYTGLQYTTAVQGSLILSVLPVLVLLLGATFVGQRITPRQSIGVVLSIAGAVAIIARGDATLLANLSLNKGDLWCLLAVIAWALQTFLMRWKPPEIDIFTFMTVVIAIGVVVVSPIYILEMASGRYMPVTPASIGAILYLAVFASALAATMFNEGVVRVGPATAGYFGNLFPIFSAAMAVAVLGESLAWFHFAGGGLVLGGIFLATIDRRRRAVQSDR